MHAFLLSCSKTHRRWIIEKRLFLIGFKPTQIKASGEDITLSQSKSNFAYYWFNILDDVNSGATSTFLRHRELRKLKMSLILDDICGLLAPLNASRRTTFQALHSTDQTGSFFEHQVIFLQYPGSKTHVRSEAWNRLEQTLRQLSHYNGCGFRFAT